MKVYAHIHSNGEVLGISLSADSVEEGVRVIALDLYPEDLNTPLYFGDYYRGTGEVAFTRASSSKAAIFGQMYSNVDSLLARNIYGPFNVSL